MICISSLIKKLFGLIIILLIQGSFSFHIQIKLFNIALGLRVILLPLSCILKADLCSLILAFFCLGHSPFHCLFIFLLDFNVFRKPEADENNRKKNNP